MSKKKDNTLNIANAEIMAELIADPSTTEQLRVRIITKILDSREGQNFFKTAFEENLSWGECPCCGHKNHFCIPEDVLNQMGFVSSKVDKKVLEHTDIDSCPQYQESCKKKKICI